MLSDRLPKSGGSTATAAFGDTETTNKNRLKNGQMLGNKKFRLKDLELIKEFLKIFCIKIYQNKTKQFSDNLNYLWKYEIVCGQDDMTINFKNNN